jgi:hypothetical protein
LPQTSTQIHKGAGFYLLEPKILRIQQRYVAGENKSEIAKKEKVDRGTVARIVRFPEVQNFIAQAQQEFFGLVPDAMAALRHALRVEKNPTIALAVPTRRSDRQIEIVPAYGDSSLKVPIPTCPYFFRPVSRHRFQYLTG